MTHLLRKVVQNNFRSVIIKNGDPAWLSISFRSLSVVPSIYDGEQDPAPKFFSQDVQILLKRLTRPDFSRVFRKRTNSGLTLLRTPKYKFLTNEELEAEIAASNRKAQRLLQMPPVVKVQQPINDVISKDPALVGYDNSAFLFTDITFGIDNEHRLIVQRDPDGTLHSCNHDIRKRLNQTYFPILGRKIREPLMFTDEEKLNSLLDRSQYEFVLDRACIQYEPDEATYQRVTSITYQHVDNSQSYDILRSTRHFGPLVFYLAWQHILDSLMLELLQTSQLREAVLLITLRHNVQGDVVNGDIAMKLTKEILATPILLSKQERLTEEDIQLDSKCIEVVEKYIAHNSAMKSKQELALQGYRESYQQLIELSRGLRKAHGSV